MFRRLRRRYHLLLGGEVAALSIVGLAAVGLTMRPATDRQLERDVRNRDVMLCLDVSASMNELDAIVLRQFAELAAGLRGERIGLTIFNGSAITVFPLTDDAEFIEATLEEAATALGPAQALVRRGHRGGRNVADRRWPGVVRDALRRWRAGAVAVDRVRHRQRPRRRADPRALGGRRPRPPAGHPRLRARRRRPDHRRRRRRPARWPPSRPAAPSSRPTRVRRPPTVVDRDRTAGGESASTFLPRSSPTTGRRRGSSPCVAGLGALLAVGWALRR